MGFDWFVLLVLGHCVSNANRLQTDSVNRLVCPASCSQVQNMYHMVKAHRNIVSMFSASLQVSDRRVVCERLGG